MIAAAMLVMALATSVPSTAPSAGCGDLILAQDELVAALESQVAELKKAVAERTTQVVALELVADTLNKQAAIYNQMYLAEAEAAAKDRKRAAWQERWQALKYGALGLSAGVLLMEVAE